jgi:exonuclease III
MTEPEFAPYQAYFSLADSKYAGSAVFLNKTELSKPISVRYNLGDENTMSAKEHHTDGRIIVIEVSSIFELWLACKATLFTITRLTLTRRFLSRLLSFHLL